MTEVKVYENRIIVDDAEYHFSHGDVIYIKGVSFKRGNGRNLDVTSDMNKHYDVAVRDDYFLFTIQEKKKEAKGHFDLSLFLGDIATLIDKAAEEDSNALLLHSLYLSVFVASKECKKDVDEFFQHIVNMEVPSVQEDYDQMALNFVGSNVYDKAKESSS